MGGGLQDTKPREFTRDDFIRLVNAMEQLSRVVVPPFPPTSLSLCLSPPIGNLAWHLEK